MEEEEKSRLEQFKEFVELDPTDTFSRYALAIEYMGVGGFEDAVIHFKELLKLDSGYSAAYHQAAIAFKNLGKADEAKQILQQGIEVAEQKRDWHARDEMKALLETID